MVLYDIDVRCEVRLQHSFIQRHLATDTGFLEFFGAIFIALSLVFFLAGPDALLKEYIEISRNSEKK